MMNLQQAKMPKQCRYKTRCGMVVFESQDSKSLVSEEWRPFIQMKRHS